MGVVLDGSSSVCGSDPGSWVVVVAGGAVEVVVDPGGVAKVRDNGTS